MQQQFLRGAEAEKKLADIGTNFESTRSKLEGKEREIAILTKKISQFEDMLAEGPGKVEEEEKEIEEVRPYEERTTTTRSERRQRGTKRRGCVALAHRIKIIPN